MSTPDSKLIMWVRLEDQEQPFKFVVNTSEASSLDSLACLLCKSPRLQRFGIGAENIKFFGNYMGEKGSESASEEKSGNKPLRLGIPLKDLEATDTSPLVVRYLLSDNQFVIHCNLSNSRLSERFPHSTGLWHLLRNAAEKNFGALQKTDTPYFFVYTGPRYDSYRQPYGPVYGEEHIKNAYQLNCLVAESLTRKSPQDKGKLEISLSVRMEGQTSEISQTREISQTKKISQTSEISGCLLCMALMVIVLIVILGVSGQRD